MKVGKSGSHLLSLELSPGSAQGTRCSAGDRTGSVACKTTCIYPCTFFLPPPQIMFDYLKWSLRRKTLLFCEKLVTLIFYLFISLFFTYQQTKQTSFNYLGKISLVTILYLLYMMIMSLNPRNKNQPLFICLLFPPMSPLTILTGFIGFFIILKY